MTTTKTEKTYYIASVECYEAKALSGDILTADGKIIWLGMSEGYHQCQINKTSAKHYETPSKAIKDAKHFDGMPWYYRLKQGTVKVYKVYHSIEETLIETLVLDGV